MYSVDTFIPEKFKWTDGWIIWEFPDVPTVFQLYLLGLWENMNVIA